VRPAEYHHQQAGGRPSAAADELPRRYIAARGAPKMRNPLVCQLREEAIVKPGTSCPPIERFSRAKEPAMATAWLHAPRNDPPTLPLVGPGHIVDLEERAPVVRPPVGVYAGLVGTLALVAIALLWVSPASAVPSYSG
jgi:hypothetical protein